jgi:hypothetical protein
LTSVSASFCRLIIICRPALQVAHNSSSAVATKPAIIDVPSSSTSPQKPSNSDPNFQTPLRLPRAFQHSPHSTGNAALDAARNRFLRALQDKEQRASSQEVSPMKPKMHSSASSQDVVVIHDVPVVLSAAAELVFENAAEGRRLLKL